MSQPFGFAGVNCQGQGCGKNSFMDVRLLELGAFMMNDRDFLRKSGQQLLCTTCNQKHLQDKREADSLAAQKAAADRAVAAAVAAEAAAAAAADQEAAELQEELDQLESEDGGGAAAAGGGAGWVCGACTLANDAASTACATCGGAAADAGASSIFATPAST